MVDGLGHLSDEGSQQGYAHTDVITLEVSCVGRVRVRVRVRMERRAQETLEVRRAVMDNGDDSDDATVHPPSTSKGLWPLRGVR
jgi:hypothetical protein